MLHLTGTLSPIILDIHLSVEIFEIPALLGWHVYRTKLVREIFFRGTNFLMKNAPNFSPPLFCVSKTHAQYDWTTGALDNGNEWRKFCAVPCLYPLRSLVCTLFNKGASRGAFRLPGAGGDHFHCTVEPLPGHIRCRQTLKTLTSLNNESRPFSLGGNSIWSFPSVSSLSDYSIWRS